MMTTENGYGMMTTDMNISTEEFPSQVHFQERNPMAQSKILPTERLTLVLGEATSALTSAKALRRTISQILRDWAIMPQEAILLELREALDRANTQPLPEAIPEALAYLKENSRRLQSARNRHRAKRDIPLSEFNPAEFFSQEEEPVKVTALPGMSLEDIEAKLKELGE